MFKDIRVVAAARTLAVFGVAVGVGMITTHAIQTYGIMAVITVVAVVLAAYIMYSVYNIMLLGLEHEKEHQELAESLKKPGL